MEREFSTHKMRGGSRNTRNDVFFTYSIAFKQGGFEVRSGFVISSFQGIALIRGTIEGE